jgi:hypothetical protein
MRPMWSKIQRPIEHVKRRHRRPMFDSFLNSTAPHYIEGEYCAICKQKFTGTALSHVRSKHEGRAAKEFVNARLHK